MPEQIEDREQLYVLLHEFDDRTIAMKALLEKYLKNNQSSMDMHELYLIQSYHDYLTFLEAKYEQIDQWLSTNNQNRES